MSMSEAGPCGEQLVHRNDVPQRIVEAFDKAAGEDPVFKSLYSFHTETNMWRAALQVKIWYPNNERVYPVQYYEIQLPANDGNAEEKEFTVIQLGKTKDVDDCGGIDATMESRCVGDVAVGGRCQAWREWIFSEIEK